MIKRKKKIILFFLLGVLLLYIYEFSDYLSLEHIQKNIHRIKDYYDNNILKFIFIFILSYIFIITLSVPGAIILTLLAGSIFNLILGTFLVTISASLGALISFNLSRYFFRESVMYRFRRQYSFVEERLKVNGISYLLIIRLFPASPFGIINLVMGLTSIDAWRFFWITAIAMIPGNLIYVYAGKRILEIRDVKEILSPSIILLLLLIPFLPLLFKKIFYFLSRLRQV